MSFAAKTLAKFRKTSEERKRYMVDYTEWLDEGEEVNSVVFDITPVTTPALVVDAFSIEDDGTSVVFFANFGYDDVEYFVELTVNTSGGQIKQDRIEFAICDYD